MNRPIVLIVLSLVATLFTPAAAAMEPPSCAPPFGLPWGNEDYDPCRCLYTGPAGFCLVPEGPVDDSTHAASTSGCALLDEPVCWTARFACYYVGPPVERQVNEHFGPYWDAPDEWRWRACERQPGAVDDAAVTDPADPSHSHVVNELVATSTSTEPCALLDEPVCWSARFACYYAGPPVERQLRQIIPWAGEACERQPGGGDATTAASSTTEPCALLDDTACWTLRFACYYAGPPVQRAASDYLDWVFHCPTQPGAAADSLQDGDHNTLHAATGLSP